VRSTVQGVQVTAPFGHYTDAAQVIASSLPKTDAAPEIPNAVL